jgi:hypothetical protein
VDWTRKASVISDDNILLLIYIASFTLQSAIDLTINNQCSIKLASPMYFIKDASCRIQFPRQVNSKSIMKTSFITGIDRDTFGGILLYHLQRKVNVSISTQLLMIWGYKPNKLYSHALLIEHESTLVWNEDKLKRLYDAYNSQCDASTNIGRWLLNDNTKLRTVFKLSHGCFETEVVISRERRLPLLRKPLWIDSNR